MAKSPKAINGGEAPTLDELKRVIDEDPGPETIEESLRAAMEEQEGSDDDHADDENEKDSDEDENQDDGESGETEENRQDDEKKKGSDDVDNEKKADKDEDAIEPPPECPILNVQLVYPFPNFVL